MPLLSDRQRLLKDLETSMMMTAMMYILDLDGDFRPPIKNLRSYIQALNSDDAYLDVYEVCATAWSEVWENRYLGGRRYRLRPKTCLEEFHEDTPYLFRTTTRVHLPTFEFILSKIVHHPVFLNESNHSQLPVAWQLYVALDRLGHNGQGTSLGRTMGLWKLGHGTIHLYMSRVITALLSIEGDWVYWHNAQRRKEMAARMWVEFGFKSCVGFVDGTYLPLHRKPADHGNVYLNRKSQYAVNSQVVVDDLKRVLHFLVGFPGSVHDSMAFRESLLVTRPELCFSPGEYLLSDSAYGASKCLVPAYKARQVDNRDDPLEVTKIRAFNTWLAKCRVRNENAIGMLKRRWACLSGMRVEINEADDVDRAKRMARACVVLHNLCLEAGDPWEEQDRLTDDDGEDEAEEHLVAGRGVSPGQRKRQAVRELQARWLEIQRSKGLQP